jgi:hypothetical protein
MKMRKGLSLLGVVLLLCGVLQAQVQYTFKSYPGITIYAINNAGRMVGAYNGKPIKIDLAGRYFPITIPNATSITPAGLNKYGDISGTCVNAYGLLRAFILYRNGYVRMTAILPWIRW